MSKLTTVSELRKGQTFLDIWGNPWKKTTGKKEPRCIAQQGEVLFAFDPNFSCYTCSREEAVEDLRVRAGGGEKIWEYRLKAMQQDPYLTMREELRRLADSAIMSYNARSVNLQEGLYQLLRTYPPLPNHG